MPKDVSIGVVMPVHNCLKYSKETFESFKTKHPYTWIIVDNGSTDGTEEWVKELQDANLSTDIAQPDVIYIKNEENSGVAKAWNQGIIEAFSQNCDVAFVINNDLIFAEDTVDNLVDWYGLEEDRKFEFVTVFNIGDDLNMLKHYERQRKATPHPQFIGFLLGHRTVKRIGLFDEGYIGGYFEDNDYCARMEVEGITPVVCMDAPVMHYGSRTLKEGGLDKKAHDDQFTQNRVRFKEKWGWYPELEPHRKPKVEVSKDKPRLLWIGDAVAYTGFAKVTHNVLDELKDIWDIQIIGINHRGDPHDYNDLKIYPATIGGDPFGQGRLNGFVNTFNPHVICAINDPWVIARYLKQGPFPMPFVGYIPVDSPHVPHLQAMNALDAAIFYTEFGLEEGRKVGFNGLAYTVPHGVDTRIYHPVPKAEARKTLGLQDPITEDCFMFGYVGQNQPRKRQDLCIKYFAKWVEKYNPPKDVLLYFHCPPTNAGWDLRDLTELFGMQGRIVIPDKFLSFWSGILEENMYLLYSSLDAHISTTLGEGFGLSSIESMACGVPNMAPRWSALGEWAKGAMHFVECTSTTINTGNINTIGGIADEEQFVEGLQKLYTDAKYRQELRTKGFECIQDPKYRWANIAAQFDAVFRDVLGRFQEDRQKKTNRETISEESGNIKVLAEV